MYKLFHSPGTCSRAVHVALQEIGADFSLEAVNIRDKANQSPEFKRINPRGNVPVLMDGDLAIREGAAILVHLLDKENSALLPREGAARAVALEWLMFANATLHPAYSTAFGLLGSGQGESPAMQAAIQRIDTLWKEIDTRLAASRYLAGETLTVADILVSVIAGWNGKFPQVTIGANSERLVWEVTERPAFRTAVENETEKQAAA